MKKLLISLFMLAGVAAGVGAACNGPYCWDDRGASIQTAPALYTNTKANILSLAPWTTGQVIVCTDCTYTKICVSTGALAGQWASPAMSTGTFAAGASSCQ